MSIFHTFFCARTNFSRNVRLETMDVRTNRLLCMKEKNAILFFFISLFLLFSFLHKKYASSKFTVSAPLLCWGITFSLTFWKGRGIRKKWILVWTYRVAVTDISLGACCVSCQDFVKQNMVLRAQYQMLILVCFSQTTNQCCFGNFESLALNNALISTSMSAQY